MARYLGRDSSINSSQASVILDEVVCDQNMGSVSHEAITMQVFKQVLLPPNTGDIDDDGPLTDDSYVSNVLSTDDVTSYVSNALSTDNVASYVSNTLITDEVASYVSNKGFKGSNTGSITNLRMHLKERLDI